MYFLRDTDHTKNHLNARAIFEYCQSFFLILFLSTQAYAGAWTQSPGDLQVINSFSYYHSNERFNASGNRRDQPRYRKWEWNPYVEYGFDQDTTFGASLWLDKAWAKTRTKNE